MAGQPDTRQIGARAYLGKGWSFPVLPVNGGLSYAAYENDVEQAVEIILRTSPGERVMLPDFGAGLRDFLFAGNSPTTQRLVEQAVTQALTTYEPRITVEQVTASAVDDEPNMILIEIDYVVRRSNAHYNRVYPFFLHEGE